jgi:hypothetical protein
VEWSFDRAGRHLFKQGDEFIESDVVYAVKEPLIVEFVKNPPGQAYRRSALRAILRGEV